MGKPITTQEFAEAMQGFDVRGKVAIAVSGGGDSMALAVLLQEWAQAQGVELCALTIDHQMREGSSAEASQVHEWLEACGIKHKVLVWEGEKPDTHLQEAARDARYALLLEECKAQGIHVLAVAHNLEDQAETFWMRLAHGSGLDGLSSMAAVRELYGVQLIRPVMHFTRAQLRATCEDKDIAWVEDPSNEDAKYLRVKLREFEGVLAEEGMTPERLNKTIQKLEDARQALHSIAEHTMDACTVWYHPGYVFVDTGVLRTCPVDIQRRVLSAILQRVYPNTYALGFDKLEQTRQDILEENFAGRTIGGCEIVPVKTGGVHILREESKVELAPVREGEIWDKRFRISGMSDESLHLSALGEEGLKQLRKNGGEQGLFIDLPFKVKRVFPAVWREQTLLAVPHIGYYDPSCEKGLADLQVIFVHS